MSKRKASKKTLRAAVRFLREGRDLMNHGGKHWIKGSEKRYVGENHVPGHRGSHHRINGYTMPAFCSIGSIKQASGVGAGGFFKPGNPDHVAAMLASITLAELINPDKMKRGLREAERLADREMTHYGLKKKEYESFVVRKAYPVAEGIIVNFNDCNATQWADVRSKFTKAAKRLADRAR